MNWEFIKEVGFGNFLRRKLSRQFLKRVLRRDCHLRLANGFVLRLPRQSQFATEVYITRGNVDWGAEEILRKTLEPGGDFLDIGANMGYYSALIYDRCRSVHAFEPDPRNVDTLSSTCRQLPNVKVHPMAVGARTGKANFVLAECSAVSQLAILNNGDTQPQTQTVVDIVTVDDHCRRHNLKITGIKIDVEGADYDVLLGARERLSQDQPLALAEIGWSPELRALLEPMRYTMFAPVRKKANRQLSFSEITGPNQATKMLFLVPGRLRDKFAALCK